MKKVSVITVCKNNVAGLKVTLESIVNQTYDSYEIIVVDGASTDGTLEIIQGYGRKISHWVSEPDSGIYHAQNKGIDMASGEYCLFLNSGDFLSDENVLEKIFSVPDQADIMYGDMLLKNGELIYMKSPEHIGTKRMLADTLWHPVTFIRSSLFKKYGKYDQRFKIAADYELFVRLIIKKKISMRYISVAVSVFHTGGVSSRHEFRRQLEEERRTIQDMYFNPFLLFLFRLYSKIRN